MDKENDIVGARPVDSSLTIKEWVMKYLNYLPLFIVSVGLFIGAGMFYLRYTVPKYKATTLILVQDENSGLGSGASNDLIEKALSAGSKINMDNTLQLMRASSLMKRVVSNNHFNISYYKIGAVRNTDIYLDAPFRLKELIGGDSSSTLNFTLTNLSSSGGIIKTGNKSSIKRTVFKWNSSLDISGRQFQLVPEVKIFNKDDNYIVVCNPVEKTVSEILSKYAVGMLSSKTSIIQLNILIENLNRGKDILDAIAKEYNQVNLENKNQVSKATVRFIDDRLSTVSQELGGIEGNLQSYQGKNQLVDVEAQATTTMSNSNEVNKNLTDINVQQQVVDMLRNYLINPLNKDRLVPSTLGLSDITLTALIAKYNELQLQKEKEAPSLAENSILLKDINGQINNVRDNLLENLQNITKNMQLKENNLQQQNSQNRNFLTSLPYKQRTLQDIKRRQTIMEGLYLYLLQKREEAAISATPKILNFQQIDPASGFGPVEPDPGVMKFFVLGGLLLPALLIYIRGLLNDKVISKQDISRLTAAPVIGEINHIRGRKNKDLYPVTDPIAEDQLQNIRANLSLIQNRKDKQVFLITSSRSSEGKSFVSFNLAAVLAEGGKKVALLQFDLRKQDALGEVFSASATGITEYLNGDNNILSEAYQSIESMPSLHIFKTGYMAVNPVSLLLSDRMPLLFEELKREYNYILIDTAPAGQVNDAYILNKYSDVVLYIVRQRYTLKKEVTGIQNASDKKLNNLYIVVNDVKAKGPNSYYGYNQKQTIHYSAKKEKSRSSTPV